MFVIEAFISAFIITQLNPFYFEIPDFKFQFEESKQISRPEIKNNSFVGVDIKSKSGVAVDMESGYILFEKNSNDISSIASITKLMTGLVFLDYNLDLSQKITITNEDKHFGATPHFFTGDLVSLNDVLKAVLVSSDNDGAHALARVTPDGVKGFVEKMNQKAKEIGMKNSFFVEPTGLSSDNISTASDLVLLLKYATKNKLIKDITTSPKEVIYVDSGKNKEREVVLYATDKLTSSRYLDLVLGKTGYLPEAGYCLATTLLGQLNREVAIVVLNSDSIESRFEDVKAIEYFISQRYKF